MAHVTQVVFVSEVQKRHAPSFVQRDIFAQKERKHPTYVLRAFIAQNALLTQFLAPKNASAFLARMRFNVHHDSNST
jgi:hypothetical protein